MLLTMFTMFNIYNVNQYVCSKIMNNRNRNISIVMEVRALIFCINILLCTTPAEYPIAYRCGVSLQKIEYVKFVTN